MKLFQNILCSAVVTVVIALTDEVDFVFICEDLGWLEVTVASVGVETSVCSVVANII
jgi:hypothetical protein